MFSGLSSSWPPKAKNAPMAITSATRTRSLERFTAFASSVAAARRTLQQVRRPLRLVVDELQQPPARRAQALREHQHQLHQDLGAEHGLLDDDAREVLAVEH